MDDFNPDDPDTVTVFYDLSLWDTDQRAALIESFANESIPHAWRSNEIVIPETFEAVADEIFDRLDDELGPFPILLAEDADSTEFQLEDWPDDELEMIREQLVVAEIPHRWHGMQLFVAVEATDDVDDLLDAIESGDVAVTESDAPDGVLSTLFSIGDNMTRSIDDASSRAQLFDLVPVLKVSSPPYGLAARQWESILDSVSALASAFSSDTFEPELIESAARDLRNRCRPWV